MLSGMLQFDQLHGLIIAAGDNVVFVGTERDAVDPIGVLVQREELTTGFRLPETNCSVVAAGQNSIAVPSEYDATDHAAVALEQLKLLAGGGIPEANRLVRSTGCDLTSIMIKRHELDRM